MKQWVILMAGQGCGGIDSVAIRDTEVEAETEKRRRPEWPNEMETDEVVTSRSRQGHGGVLDCDMPGEAGI